MNDADPQLAAIQVLARWTKAFSESDVAAIVDLYAHDALFFGTSDSSLTRNRQGIVAYFEKALLNNRPRGAVIQEHDILVLSDQVVVISGRDTVTGTREGRPYSGHGRFTFVIEKRASAWKIVHFHRSPAPG